MVVMVVAMILPVPMAFMHSPALGVVIVVRMTPNKLLHRADVPNVPAPKDSAGWKRQRGSDQSMNSPSWCELRNSQKDAPFLPT
jgi:hypothetical protein